MFFSRNAGVTELPCLPQKTNTLDTLEVCMLENINGMCMCAGVQILVCERTRIGLRYARACMTHARLQATCVACVKAL